MENDVDHLRSSITHLELAYIADVGELVNYRSDIDHLHSPTCWRVVKVDLIFDRSVTVCLCMLLGDAV